MNDPVDKLHSLKFRSFYSHFRAESPALWFLCFYILIEYIRPQSMYPVLDILPWGQLAILACVASVFMTGSKAGGFGALDNMFVALSLIVILSGVFAWDPALSMKQWTTYASWMLMYFCMVSILTTPARLLLFAIFFILINFKMSQHGARTFAMRGFSFAGWGLAGSPGWFHNSGEFALQMGIIFSMSLSLLLALKKYFTSIVRWRLLMLLFPGTAAITIIGTSSRGGQLALAAVLLVFLLKGKYLIRNAVILATVVYIGLSFLPEEQFARFDTMGEDETSEMRLLHWNAAMKVIDEEAWGIGYSNWMEYYEAKFHPERVEQIHNTVLQSFVELGYAGGILFHLTLITAVFMNGRTKREMARLDSPDGDAMAGIAFGLNLGLLSTFVAAFFMSVLYYPMYWFAFALTSALRQVSKNKVKEMSGIAVLTNNKSQSLV